jgi:hypothetical protein
VEIILKNRLKAEDVREVSEALLKKHLSLAVDGYKLTTEMALSVLMKAAIEKRSIEAVCADLEAVVDSNTLREALNRELTATDLRQHEAQFNEALADCIPAAMARGGLEMAVDFHDEPFYGKSATLRAYTVRGEAQDGTTHFWRIATLYVIWREVRLTLALTYVLPDDTPLAVLQRLLERRAALGVAPRVLYLDKGFASGAIIRYLQDTARLPAIIACSIRGKRGGTRALCRGRKAYRTRYTFSDGTTTEVAVVPTLKRQRKSERFKRTWLLFIVIHLDWSAKQVQQRYRRRFGIEASYRQLGQVRAHTTSRNPALRFFFLALALLLIDLWVFLRCLATRTVGRGPFRLDADRFRLARFIAFLRRAIEHSYGTIMSIPVYSSQPIP